MVKVISNRQRMQRHVKTFKDMHRILQNEQKVRRRRNDKEPQLLVGDQTEARAFAAFFCILAQGLEKNGRHKHHTHHTETLHRRLDEVKKALEIPLKLKS